MASSDWHAHVCSLMVFKPQRLWMRFLRVCSRPILVSQTQGLPLPAEFTTRSSFWRTLLQHSPLSQNTRSIISDFLVNCSVARSDPPSAPTTSMSSLQDAQLHTPYHTCTCHLRFSVAGYQLLINYLYAHHIHVLFIMYGSGSRPQHTATVCLCRYSDFTPLHKLWQQYVEELLKLSQDREACILTADFHGCSLQVTQAANPVHVGLAGIVIKDTAATFTIITQSDCVRYIPKDGSTFCFSLDDRAMVTMFGSSLQRERSKA